MTAGASEPAAGQALPDDPAQLLRLVTLAMPFGKYQGRVIADLPGLIWPGSLTGAFPGASWGACWP